jgi:hypothetical protein
LGGDLVVAAASREVFVAEAQAAGIDAAAAEALFERLRVASGEGAALRMSREGFVRHARTVGIEEASAADLYARLTALFASADGATFSRRGWFTVASPAYWALVTEADWIWFSLFVVLGLLLFLAGLFFFYGAFHLWVGWVLLFAGVAVALLLNGRGVRLWVAGLIAVAVGWLGLFVVIAAFTGDQGEVELPEGLVGDGVLVIPALAFSWAVVFGLANVLTALEWSGRAAGVALAVAASFGGSLMVWGVGFPGATDQSSPTPVGSPAQLVADRTQDRLRPAGAAGELHLTAKPQMVHTPLAQRHVLRHRARASSADKTPQGDVQGR